MTRCSVGLVLHSKTPGEPSGLCCKQYLILISCEWLKSPPLNGKRLKQLQTLCDLDVAHSLSTDRRNVQALAAVSLGNGLPLCLRLSAQYVQQKAENIYFPLCLWDAAAVDFSVYSVFLLLLVCGCGCLEAVGGWMWDLASF